MVAKIQDGRMVGTVVPTKAPVPGEAGGATTMRNTMTIGIRTLVGTMVVALGIGLGSVGPASASINVNEFDAGGLGGKLSAPTTYLATRGDRPAVPPHPFQGRFRIGFLAE